MQCSKEKIYITSDLIILQWRHRWLKVAFKCWRFDLNIAGIIEGCCLSINEEYFSENMNPPKLILNGWCFDLNTILTDDLWNLLDVSSKKGSNKPSI